MKYEQEARGRQGMEDRIKELNTMLQAMQSDFAKCAKGISPCFFCENDDVCSAVGDNGCCFKWKSHN
jgi:hypothetical protein